MTKFIRNNTKKLMAIFGVLLMVVFALPSLKLGNGGSESGSRLVGRVGDGEKVFQSDLTRANQDWDGLERIQVQVGSEWVSWKSQLLQTTPDRGPANPTFRMLADQISYHPEMYALLLKEADREGVSISSAEVDSDMDRMNLAVQVPQEKRTIPIGDLEQLNSDYAAATRHAFASLSRVFMVMQQAQQSVKVSEPRARIQMATLAQDFRVGCVEFTADEFLPKVSEPGDAELSKLFLQYSAEDPGHATAANPHGFGYRFPNRVTLQYLAVPIDEIRRQVKASRDDYSWKVDAYKLYYANPNDYLAEPSTQPTSKPASRPTTKPFEEAREQIINEDLIEPQVQKKARDVLDRINARLANDWSVYSSQHPPVASATSPTTQFSDRYTTYEYLQQVALDVQKQTGVLPTLAQIGKFSSSKDLISEPGIGHATYNGSTLLAAYATTWPIAVVPPQSQSNSSALQLYQPSPTFRDSAGSAYVFRITAVKPNAPPDSLDDVIAQVKKDAKTAAAYDLAKAAAENVVATAASRESTTKPSTGPTTRTIDDTALEAAASAAGRKVIQTDAFRLAASTPIEPLTLDATGAATFRSEAVSLLHVATTRPATTVSVIALPVQNRVYAAQLLAVEPKWPAGEEQAVLAETAHSIIGQAGQGIQIGWLQFNNVVERLNWKDERKKSGGDEAGS